jgi:hypothetical protein
LACTAGRDERRRRGPGAGAAVVAIADGADMMLGEVLALMVYVLIQA